MSVSFINSNRKGKLLVHDGFIFRKERDQGESSYWKCKGTNCKARITLKNEAYNNFVGEHNHSPAHKELYRRFFNQKIRDRVKTESIENLWKIYKEEVENASSLPYFASHVPSRDAIRKLMLLPKRPRPPKRPPPTCQRSNPNKLFSFITSNRKGKLLVYEGFIFRKEREHGDRSYWKCKVTNCKARVLLKNGVYNNFFGDHNHTPAEKELNRRCFIEKIRDRAEKEPNKDIWEIYREEAKKAVASSDSTLDVPSRESVRKLFSKIRSHSRPQLLPGTNSSWDFNQPKTIEEHGLPEKPISFAAFHPPNATISVPPATDVQISVMSDLQIAGTSRLESVLPDVEGQSSNLAEGFTVNPNLGSFSTIDSQILPKQEIIATEEERPNAFGSFSFLQSSAFFTRHSTNLKLEPLSVLPKVDVENRSSVNDSQIIIKQEIIEPEEQPHRSHLVATCQPPSTTISKPPESEPVLPDVLAENSSSDNGSQIIIKQEIIETEELEHDAFESSPFLQSTESSSRYSTNVIQNLTKVSLSPEKTTTFAHSDYQSQISWPSEIAAKKIHKGSSKACYSKKNPREDSQDVRQKDQCDVFGVFVASKLRTLDRKSCACLQKAIADLIFEAELQTAGTSYSKSQHAGAEEESSSAIKINTVSPNLNNFSTCESQIKRGTIEPEEQQPNASVSSPFLQSSASCSLDFTNLEKELTSEESKFQSQDSSASKKAAKRPRQDSPKTYSSKEDNTEDSEEFQDMQPKEDLIAFGAFVASKMKKLDWKSCAYLQIAIVDLIFKVELRISSIAEDKASFDIMSDSFIPGLQEAVA